MPKWLDRPIFDIALWFYMGIILLVNIGFSYVPMIGTPIGVFSPMAIVVGTVFVARDYAQRHVGHWVWLGMIAGTFFSYIFADPFVATASAAAFFVSEAVDWLIFTITKKPFGQRVLVSSAIATPVDTAVFLLGISAFGWGTFVLMIISKMIASVVIWLINKEPVLMMGAGSFQIPDGFELHGNIIQATGGGPGMAVYHNADGSMEIFSPTSESRIGQAIGAGNDRVMPGDGMPSRAGGMGVSASYVGNVGPGGGIGSGEAQGGPGGAGGYSSKGALFSAAGGGGSAFASGKGAVARGGRGGDGLYIDADGNAQVVPGEPGEVAKG